MITLIWSAHVNGSVLPPLFSDLYSGIRSMYRNYFYEKHKNVKTLEIKMIK